MFFNFSVSSRRCLSSPLFTVLTCNDNVATTRTWSLPTWAPRLALTYWSDRVHFWLSYDQWLTGLLSGDFQVVLWMVLCWNSVPPMTKLFSTYRSESLSPLLLMHLKLWVPMALFLPVLSSSTLALRSPTIRRTSYRDVVQFCFSNYSYNSSLISSSASFVGA